MLRFRDICLYTFSRQAAFRFLFVAAVAACATAIAPMTPAANAQGFVSGPEPVKVELSYDHTKSGSCPMPNLSGPKNAAQYADPQNPASVEIPVSNFFKNRDNFSCPVLEFSAATVVLDHPSGPLNGMIADPNATPTTVTLTGGAAAVLTADGKARDTQGGDQHGFVVAVAADVNDKAAGRPARNQACTASRGWSTSSPGRKTLSTDVACELSDLRVVSGSVKKEGGQVTSFQAELVSDAWYKADHGSGQVGPIQKGARYRVTLRTVYEFSKAEDSIRFKSLDPTVEEGLQPKGFQTLKPEVEFNLRTKPEGKIVLTVTKVSTGEVITEESATLSATTGPTPWNFEIEDFEGPEEGNVILVAALQDLEGNILATTEEVVYVNVARDFTIDHIEVVQVVQDPYNSIPLVGGKAFTIRVFPKLADPGTPLSGVPVSVELIVDGNSAELTDGGEATILTENPNRGEVQHSYNWHLGAEGVPARAFELTVKATLNPGETVPETNFDNNTKEITVDFEQQPPLRIRYLPVCIQPPGQKEVCPGNWLDGAGEYVRRMFPVADELFDYSGLDRDPLMWPEVPNTEEKYNKLLAELNRIFTDESSARMGFVTFDQLIGLLPGKTGGENTLGGTVGGISSPPWMGHQGRVSLVQDMAGIPYHGQISTAVTVAHEIGHNLGLRHPRKDSCYPWDRPGSLWPFNNSTIQQHGADPIDGEIKIGQPPNHPDVQYDLMGACGTWSSWISGLHYVWLFTGEFEPSSEQPSLSGPKRRRAAVSGEFAYVGGTVSADGILGDLDPVDRFTGTAAPNMSQPDGEYCLRFSDGAGTVLGENCFAVGFRDIETGKLISEQFFSRLVLLPAGTASIALYHLGAELDRVSASGSVPQVTIQSPTGGESWDAAMDQTIRWTGTDMDGDSLVYSVFYSHSSDGGWRSLANGLTDTQLQFDPSQIQGGPQVWFRVSAKDGFHQGAATVGPLAVVQAPAIAAEPGRVGFGEAVVGQTANAAVVVSNSGTGPLEITGITSSSDRFEVLATGFPMKVRAGGSREIALRFKAAAVGPESGTLSIASNAAGQPNLSVALQAMGTDGQTPRVHVADGTYGFAGVSAGLSQTAAVRIENRSLVDLEVEWELTGAAVFSATGETDSTLPGGASTVVPITFAPTEPGDFTAELTVRSSDPDQPEIVVPIAGNAAEAPPRPPVPKVTAAGIVSAADFSGKRFAAEMWVALYGENLADALLVPANGLQESLGGTSVTVRDSQGTTRTAKLQFVSPTRLNFLIPAGTAEGLANVAVTNADNATGSAGIRVEKVAPGLFSAKATGEGPAAATWLRVAADGSRSEGFTFSTDAARANVPIDLGPEGDQVYISFFGTGFRGQTSVQLTIGGVTVPVAGAVAQGQFEGLDQAVAGPLPRELAGRGEVGAVFTFNGVESNMVTVNIK